MPRGNAIAETRPGGGGVGASYDGYGRLLTYTRSGDPAQANAYNGLDDRVSATSGSTTRAYVYDPDGRMLGEYGASASDVVAETIWLQPRVAANDNAPLGGDDGIGGYAPLAVATGSGSGPALSWVHGNHLGVPIVTTDASGASITPAGHAMAGFPGQTRTLSDLYYNRYRDYDSSTGRYIQADPIGLEGGSNPYLYAEANPLKYADPYGLAPGRHGPNSRYCQELLKKIQNIRKKIADRTRAIEQNTRLPEYVHGGNARDSVQGHRTLILRDKINLRELERKYAAECGGGDCPPEDSGSVETAAKVAATIGVLYIGYRVIRMIPSLAPPLWWTAPANLATP